MPKEVIIDCAEEWRELRMAELGAESYKSATLHGEVHSVFCVKTQLKECVRDGGEDRCQVSAALIIG